MWMLIYKVPECTIIESQPDDQFHPVDSIPDKRPADQQKTSLSIGLYFLYEITLEETDSFYKDTSMLIRKWSDSMEDTDTPLIKISLLREMTSKMWPSLCVLSWELPTATQTRIPQIQKSVDNFKI